MRRSFILIPLMLLTLTAHAQFVVSQDKSTLAIDGTSNVHDWTETAEVIKGTMDLTLAGNVVEEITALNLTIPVNSLKSGKSTMDKNTYKALKESEHPNIYFRLKSARVEGLNIHFIGSLTVAGSTKEVDLKATYSSSSSHIIINGEYACKMTDFGVQPPTAMLGTMKTGDDIVISFSVAFKNDINNPN